MVLLMVLLTFVLSIAVIEGVLWLKTRKAEKSGASEIVPADGRVYWHPGHAWLRILSGDQASLGIDGFALRLLGRVDEVRLPEPGNRVQRGEPFASVRQDDKWVHFASPADGTVQETNPSGLSESRQGENRYRKGWLCRIRAEDLTSAPEGLIGADAIRDWMTRQVQVVVDFFSQRSGVSQTQPMMPDGGTLVDGLLEQADDEVWDELTRLLFQSPPRPAK